MRTLIARIFDYALDGVIATEDTSFFDFCRDLPDDDAQLDRTRASTKAPTSTSWGASSIRTRPVLPRGRRPPLRRRHERRAQGHLQPDHHHADWANTSVADGDLRAEIEKLKPTATAPSSPTAASASVRSLIQRDLIDEYRVTLFP